MLIDIVLKVILAGFLFLMGSSLLIVLCVALRELLDERRKHRG